MNLKDIQALVKEGESSHLEFKKSTAQLHAAFETACAFLNGQGGTIIIGVTPTGEIIGQDVSDTTQQDIAREINKLEPPAHVEVHYVPIKNTKKVIVLRVQTGTYAPYQYDGRAYQQNQNTTVRMKQHRYEQLLVERGQLNHAWEDLLTNHFNITDLDPIEIKRAVRKGVEARRLPAGSLEESVKEILNHWKLLKDGKIINAAVVLFAKEILSIYPQCSIRLARFRGIDKLSGFMDSRHIFGNAFKLLSEADDFIRRHLPISSVFDSNRFERIDDPTLPVLAVREALVNAISHRDYSHRSGSIALAIFDDRMEIWNTGTLQTNLIRLEDLKKVHQSHPRNELIAKVLYDTGLVENWGTGTLSMIKLCKAHGLSEPEFSEYSGGFSIQFKFKEPISPTTKPIDKPKQTHIRLGQREKEIVEILKQKGELSLAEIINQMTNPPSPTTVYDYLSSLKKKGVAKTRGHGRGAVWSLVNNG